MGGEGIRKASNRKEWDGNGERGTEGTEGRRGPRIQPPPLASQNLGPALTDIPPHTQTDRDDRGDLIICPMLCFSNGTDNDATIQHVVQF